MRTETQHLIPEERPTEPIVMQVLNSSIEAVIDARRSDLIQRHLQRRLGISDCKYCIERNLISSIR